MAEYKKVQQTDVEEGGPKKEGAVQVRVVAPSALPPKYRLLVKTNKGEEFDVFVPEGGVHEGQEFTAEKIAFKNPTGNFRDGIFDCGSEGNFFAVACCCSGIAYAAIMEKLKLNECGGPGGWPKSTFWFVTVVWLIFSLTNFVSKLLDDDTANVEIQGLILSLNFAATVVMLFIVTRTRTAMRERYNIEGNCLADCLLGWFCMCCSALQMYRHMKRSGERPARFETIQAQATIV